MKIVTKWIPITAPCFMFDQDEGSLHDYMCPKCMREYPDCKERKCIKDVE